MAVPKNSFGGYCLGGLGDRNPSMGWTSGSRGEASVWGPPKAEAVCRHCLQILTANNQNLKISHNSPPDSWPVCFSVGKGVKRYMFVAWAPSQCLTPSLGNFWSERHGYKSTGFYLPRHPQLQRKKEKIVKTVHINVAIANNILAVAIMPRWNDVFQRNIDAGLRCSFSPHLVI